MTDFPSISSPTFPSTVDPRPAAQDVRLADRPAQPGSLERSQNDFSSILGRAVDAKGNTKEEKATSAAQEFVAAALVQPILAKMRESSQAAPPFGPSPEEKPFRAMLDAQIAQRIVRSKQFGLVDSVARKLLRDQGSAKESPSSHVSEDRHDSAADHATSGTKEGASLTLGSHPALSSWISSSRPSQRNAALPGVGAGQLAAGR